MLLLYLFFMSSPRPDIFPVAYPFSYHVPLRILVITVWVVLVGGMVVMGGVFLVWGAEDFVGGILDLGLGL